LEQQKNLTTSAYSKSEIFVLPDHINNTFKPLHFGDLTFFLDLSVGATMGIAAALIFVKGNLELFIHWQLTMGFLNVLKGMIVALSTQIDSRGADQCKASLNSNEEDDTIDNWEMFQNQLSLPEYLALQESSGISILPNALPKVGYCGDMVFSSHIMKMVVSCMASYYAIV
jgi:hypothetical protein